MSNLYSILLKDCFVLMLISGMIACQSNQENMGQSDEINQTPTLPEARDPQPDTVRLEAKEFVYLPPKVILPPGNEVVFVITNNGDANHRIFFEFPYGNIELEEPIAPDSIGTMTVKMPDQEGTYRFYCPMENGQHKENGMQGEIIIKEDGETTDL